MAEIQVVLADLLILRVVELWLDFIIRRERRDPIHRRRPTADRSAALFAPCANDTLCGIRQRSQAHRGDRLLARFAAAILAGTNFIEGMHRFADNPFIGNVRGMGLIAGMEIVKDKATKENFDPSLRAALTLEAKCLEEGVIVRAIGDVVAVSPPLIITETEIDDMLARIGRGLQKFAEAMSAHV